MAETAPPDAGEDAAWVAVSTPLTPTALLSLMEDPERLLRVNSQWVFEIWEWLDRDRFRLRVRNLANDRQWETRGQVQWLPDGLRLDYQEGIKAFTRMRVEEDGVGSCLWIIDDYGRLPTAEREKRTDEVDRSLTRWGHDLHRYLAAWARWSHLGPWRWYMERVWRRMTPLGRRVARLVFWVTVVEFIVFLMLIAVLVVQSVE